MRRIDRVEVHECAFDAHSLARARVAPWDRAARPCGAPAAELLGGCTR